MGLNKEQAQAAHHKDGPMMVLAGPGSGKTHTLVERIINLIENEGIPPSEILVITFSKKAALEMQERFNSNTKGKSYPVTFGTFHAIFFHILKDHYNYSKDSILTTKQKLNYINEIINELAIDNKDDVNISVFYLEKISKYKSLTKSHEERLCELFTDDEEKIIFSDLLELFDKKMKSERKINFDDMIYLCNKLLMENKNVRIKWQNIYKYFLIDEFQDINEVQYSTLKLLAGNDNNIFAVGDDDQSIYGFRGSRPDIMQEFIDKTPECKVVNLKKNYRCSSHIIDIAAKVITHNINRIEKHQVAEKADKNKGFLKVLRFKTDAEEEEYVINEIEKSIQENGYIKSTAILYRTSRNADSIEEALLKNGINYERKTESDFFYDNEFVKDIMMYIKIALNINNPILRKDIYSILNKPFRGLSREGINKASVMILEDDLFNQTENQKEAWEQFRLDVIRLRDLPPFLAVNYILKGINYEEHIIKHLVGNGKNLKKYNEIKDELLNRSRDFKNLYEWLLFVEALRECNNAEGSKGNINTKGKVVMQTVHASKGLEYDTVFIIGLMEGVFPHNKAVSESEIEEERRLLYVAITRARYNLYILGREDDHGKKISRFISEIEDLEKT